MDNQQPKFKKNAQKYFLKPNTIYGNWKTIEQVKVKTSKCTETRWKCLHIPTGDIRLKTAAYIAQFQSEEERQKYLDNLVKEDKHQMGFRNYLYRAYKIGAENRHHKFLLTFDEFMNLVKKPCYYCGEPPRPASEELLKKRGNTKEPTFYYNGIDRIDPKLDYTIDNVVTCCPTCNYMKHTLTQEGFYRQLVKIVNHLKLGSTTISEESTLQANGSGNGENPKKD